MAADAQTLSDWLSAQQRLTSGRVSDPHQDALGAASIPAWWWEQHRARQAQTPGLMPRPSNGEAEALPLGALGDPVSQLAILASPLLLKDLSDRMSGSVSIPIRNILANERGSIGGRTAMTQGSEEMGKGLDFISNGLRRATPPQGGKTYYHVADASYNAGEPIYSYDAYTQTYGSQPSWTWEGEPFNTHEVALHDSLAEARAFQQAYGGKILKITLPDDLKEAGLAGRVNEEGYPAITWSIPPEYIAVVGQ